MAAAKSKNDRHAHGCKQCHTRYEDTCDDLTDRLCMWCRVGHGFALLRDNRRPKDCCRAHSRLARKEDLTKYALSGAGPWFICPVCYRTHPHRDPTKEKNT